MVVMKHNNALKPYSINSNGADMTLELLSSKLETGDIEIPEFQRDHVWPISKASRLIESFLLGLPVPQIFLYREPKSQKWLVVDGQQRLKAVHAFFKGIYKTKEFRLNGLDSEWNNKTFEELSEPDRRRLKNVTLRATIFEQVDPADNTSIFEVFERLNTGGMSLTAQEVRNAVIGGDLNKLTKSLALKENWMLLNHKGTSENRFRDSELILRLIALEDNFETYKKPMNLFLSEYLTKHVILDTNIENEINTKFLNTINTIADTIGKDAFRLKKSVSAAVADAIYVGIARNLYDLPANIVTRYEELIQNEAFIEAIDQHTTDNDKVQLRINMAIAAFSK